MKQYSSLYFIGAGGIGMSALVRYFLAKGYRVAGYDRTSSPLTEALQSEGLEIVYDESVDLIPDYCRDPENDARRLYPGHSRHTCRAGLLQRARLQGGETGRAAGAHHPVEQGALLLGYARQDDHLEHGGPHLSRVAPSGATPFWAVSCATTTATSSCRTTRPLR